ncbi:MAG: SIMPL domain-containing protein [Rikenellaceae bacterium]
MRRVFFAVIATLFVLTASVQELSSANPNLVEVVGVSEISLAPDIFHLAITIDEGDSKGRITAAEQQKRMVREFSKIGIDATKQLKISSMGSTFEKRTTAYSTVSYTLELHSEEQLSQVVEILDALYISDVRLERTESSQLKEAQSQVRKAAIINAKEVATELCEAVGRKAGACVTIEDLSNSSGSYSTNRVMATFARAADSAEAVTPLEVKEIKVPYRVRAAFVIYD